jgi:hypothetical protein
MTGRGAKKYSLDTIPPEVKEWILKSATNITSVIPPNNTIETDEAKSVKSGTGPIEDAESLEPRVRKIRASGAPRAQINRPQARPKLKKQEEK